MAYNYAIQLTLETADPFPFEITKYNIAIP